MANEPLRRMSARPRTEAADRPRLWAEGSQRPPFVLRAFGKASLHLARQGAALPLAWAARAARHLAVGLRDGRGRIPAERLGRAGRFLPSHQRVAGWINTLAAVLSHASATADPDIPRGNALVAAIEPHLWRPDPALATVPVLPEPPPAAAASVERATPAPVVLAEPKDDDPLASIRRDLAAPQVAGRPRWQAQESPVWQETPFVPPPPPGPVATAVIQVSGYLFGWAGSILALPYGAGRALWLYAQGVDLRGICEDA